MASVPSATSAIWPGNINASNSFTLMVHTTAHSTDDIILNKDIFSGKFEVGDYISVADPDRPSANLILKVPSLQTVGGRLEISLSKNIAESLSFKSFSRVNVTKVNIENASIDFVELAFKRQFLQRGNMWRFKRAMFGRPVYIGQNIGVDGVQATIQELGNSGKPMISGIITERSHFIFRSRSTRIIWLVQISSEMWEYDQNGDIYFEKFLHKFVEPIFDKWKLLAVSHSLTVIFFTRTLYLNKSDKMVQPELFTKPSLVQRGIDGVWYQDFFKVVIENAADVDKTSQLKVLRDEFWKFSSSVGWNISNDFIKNNTRLGSRTWSGISGGGYDSPIDLSVHNNSISSNKEFSNRMNMNDNKSTYSTPIAVPSDAASGNFLEAINTTLNILDKHYMDRDLLRTGNSIVMISAGTGIFKVKPIMALISKQRMMDNGIGLDFVSLSQPPLHTVPLFHVECREHGLPDFYESPHWVNVSFVDCDKDSSTSVENSNISSSTIIDNSNTSDSAAMDRRNYRWSGLHEFNNMRDKNNDNISKDEANWGENFVALPFAEKNNGSLSYFYDYNTQISKNKMQLIHAHSLPMTLKCLLAKSYYSDFNNNNNNTHSLSRRTSNDDIAGTGSNDSISYDDNKFNMTIPYWGKINFENAINKSQKDSTLSYNNLSNTLFENNKRRERSNSVNSVGSTTNRENNDKDPCQVLSSLSSEYSISSVLSLMNNHDSSIFAPITSNNESLPLAANNLGSPSSSRRMSNSTNVANPSYSVMGVEKEINLGKSVTNNAVPANTLKKGILSTRNNTKISNAIAISNNSSSNNKEKDHSLNINNPLGFSPSSSPHYYSILNNTKSILSSSLDKGSDIMKKIGYINSLSGNNENYFDKSKEDISFISKYASRNKVNPFMKEEGESFVLKRTHNRLRWSHVFPSGKFEKSLIGHYGLNMKSLCQPAILPLTTSYIPSVTQLNEEYHIQGDYELIMDKQLCAFMSAEDLLTEMICQRLSQEFQLVEIETNMNEELLAYKNYILSNGSWSGSVLKKPSTNISKSNQINNNNKYNSSNNKNNEKELFYILSMGHRIQFLSYDPSMSQVRVTRLLWTGKNTNNTSNNNNFNDNFSSTSKKATYMYELWVPQTGEYQTMTQTFQQYPTPEYAWNTADEILLGNIELDMNNDNVKAKRLRFAILPDYTDENTLNNSTDVDTYYSKIDKLMQHIGKYCSTNEVIIDVIKDINDIYKTKNNSKNYNVVKIWLQGPNHSNPKWAFFKYDGSASMNRAFKLEFHWLACDSWLMDDFVNILHRRCTSWSLRMAQIPEFFCTSNLQVHPFRAQPYIQVPSSFINNVHMSGLWSLTAVLLVENLYLKQDKTEWIEHEEQHTDWEALGLPIPYNNNNNNNKLASPNRKISSSLSLNSNASGDNNNNNNHNNNNNNIGRSFSPSNTFSISLLHEVESSLAINNISIANNKNFVSNSIRRPRTTDRQYMHRKGFACVRIGAQGFVWLLNSAGRVSDLNVVTTKELAMKKLHELKNYAEIVGIIYDILIETFENAMTV